MVGRVFTKYVLYTLTLVQLEVFFVCRLRIRGKGTTRDLFYRTAA